MDLTQLKEAINLIKKGEQMKLEGQRIIDYAMSELKETPLQILGYQNYFTPISQALDKKVFTALFPNYIIKPFNIENSDYKTRLTAEFNGFEIMVLSQDPMPQGTTMVCVSKLPVNEKEAV